MRLTTGATELIVTGGTGKFVNATGNGKFKLHIGEKTAFSSSFTGTISF